MVNGTRTVYTCQNIVSFGKVLCDEKLMFRNCVLEIEVVVLNLMNFGRYEKCSFLDVDQRWQHQTEESSAVNINAWRQHLENVDNNFLEKYNYLSFLNFCICLAQWLVFFKCISSTLWIFRFYLIWAFLTNSDITRA